MWFETGLHQEGAGLSPAAARQGLSWGTTEVAHVGPRAPDPVLTVPLLARWVGQSSGDELMSPELPA